MPLNCQPPATAFSARFEVFLKNGSSYIQLITMMWRTSKSLCPQRLFASYVFGMMSRWAELLSIDLLSV